MYLFTYGTLMKGECRHKILSTYAEYLGEFKLNKLRLYNYPLGGFPVALPSSKEKDKVVCELYYVNSHLDEQMLSVLDSIEGEGVMYFRVKVECQLDEPAYIYIGNPDYWQDADLDEWAEGKWRGI